MRSIRAALVAVAVAAAPAAASAQVQLASQVSGVTAYSFSQIDQTGRAVNGPKTLVVKRVNPLRYADARLVGDTVTDQNSGAGAAAAALANAFNFGNAAATPNSTVKADANATPTPGPHGAPIDPCGDSALSTTQPPEAFAVCYTKVLGIVTDAENQVGLDGRVIADTILDVDAKLRTPSAAAPNTNPDAADYASAQASVTAALAKIDAHPDVAQAWPKALAANLSGKILAKNVSLAADATKNKDAIAALKLVSDQLAPLLDGGTRRQKFDDSVKAQKDWEVRMRAVAADQRLFETPPLAVPCDNQLYDQHTTVAWKATDLVDTTKTAPVSLNVVTVNCYARVAVTQGAVLAPRGTTQYSLGPAFGSTSTTMQQIYASSSGATDANASPAIIHFRVTPDSEGMALHVSWAPFSVQKHFVGASVSFSRFLFLSAGIMRDEVSVLSNGYAAGQMVPNGTTLPTSKSYPGRFAYGISINVPSAVGNKAKTQTSTAGQNPPDPGAKPGTTPTTPTKPDAKPTPKP